MLEDRRLIYLKFFMSKLLIIYFMFNKVIVNNYSIWVVIFIVVLFRIFKLWSKFKGLLIEE